MGPTKVEGVSKIGPPPTGLVKWADPKKTPNCRPGPCSKPKAPGEGEGSTNNIS